VAATVRILLIRHGESTWNADGRWQGQADPPLTERGRAQARSAADAVPPVALAVASDLERAHHTAALLVGGAGGPAVTQDRDLRERDAGAFSGLTRAEIFERYPGLLPDDPTRRGEEGVAALIAPPGWEPDDRLAERAWRAIERIAAALVASGDDDRTGLAVTHGGLIYAVERSLGHEPTRIANLEGRWLDRSDGPWRLGPRQLLLDPATDAITRPRPT